MVSLLMVSRRWIHGFAAPLEFVGDCSLYSPAATVLEELHPVTDFEGVFDDTAETCVDFWHLKPRSPQSALDMVVPKQLPSLSPCCRTSSSRCMDKTIPILPQCSRWSTWSQRLGCSFNFLGCLFRTVFSWCLHRFNWIVYAGPRTIDGARPQKIPPFVSQNRYRNDDWTHERQGFADMGRHHPKQQNWTDRKVVGSLFQQDFTQTFQHRQVTHAEIKEEIRIVEAITAALGQEIEMANKLPGDGI